MTRIVVQIYEIQDPREAETVISLGVDRIGSVILSARDWKVAAIREAILVSRSAGVKHSLIPLLSQQDILFRAMEYYQPDILHFCESLTAHPGEKIDLQGCVDLQNTMRARYPDIEIMRSIPVAEPKTDQAVPTLDIAESFEDLSDYFLTDTTLSNQPVKGYIGITGQTSDWRVAKALVENTRVPVILAGGLSPENVYEGIMAVRPFGVDSCTRTNAVGQDGRPVRFMKDRNRVKAFVQEVRRAEREIQKSCNVTSGK